MASNGATGETFLILPPMPQPSSLLLPHTKVAEQIAKKLSVAIPSTVLCKAEEKVRVLESRVATGSFGKHDTKPNRVAVMLEQLYRQGYEQRLLWKDLASAMGTKASYLEELQRKLNLYQDYPVSQGVATCSRSNHQVATCLETRDRALTLSTTTLDIGQPSSNASPSDGRSDLQNHLETIAIRLSVHLVDPHGVCKQARKFLLNLEDWIRNDPTQSASSKKGMLYDWARNQAAYQAAAIYYVTGNHMRNTRTKQVSHQINNNLPTVLISLEDLAEASKEVTVRDLKKILTHVIKIGDKMNLSAKTLSNDLEPASKRRKVHSNYCNKRQGDPLAPTTTGSSDDALCERKIGQEENETGDTIEYLENIDWERRVISEACDMAKKELADSSSPDSGSWSESLLVRKAANDVIAKYGLA